MNKKSKLCTLMLAASLMLAAPVSGCAKWFGGSTVNQSYVKLVDFEDITETVGLGENYVLPSGVAFDADGNDYRVVYEVKDWNGEKVTVTNGRFKVKELGKAKYIITCYAQIEEEKYLTRTITLDVVDRAAPVISNETMPYAFAGNEYTIRGVKITDNNNEVITPSYQVFDAEGTEVAVENGKFTPNSTGEYTLKVTATDSFGNTSEKNIPIYVREPMGDYVLENFNDEYGLPVFSVKQAMLTEDDVVYHETFDPTPENAENDDARTGVAEGNSVLSTSASYGAHYYFKFDNTFSEIGDFEYIYIKAYIKSSIADYKPQVTLYSKNEPLGAGAGVQYNVNEWVEIRLTKEDICAPDSTFADVNEMRDGETPLDCFFRKMTSESGYYLFYIPNHEYEMNGTKVKDNANNYVLYVDEIGYKPVFNPTADVEESYDLGEWVTVDPVVETDEAAGKYSIDVKITSPSGELVTLSDNKFRLVEAGQYTVELTYVSDTYNGYTKYVIDAISTKEITIGEYTGAPTMGEVITIPDATIEGGTITASVSVEGQNMAMLSSNTFKANVAGDYVVTYASEIDGLVYKKSFVISVARGQYASNEVNSFSSKAEMTDNIALDGFNADWLASYEGAYGVVKLTSPARWSYFAFKQLQEMSAYSGYDYVVLRILVPETTTLNSTSLFFAESISCTFGENRGEWVEYAFSADKFREVWNKTDFHAWTKCISMSIEGDIYLDAVYMMNDISSLGLEAVVTNLTNAGEAIVDGNQFSVALPSSAPEGAVITVKDSNGNTVADISNITAKYGEYTIEITCAGYVGKMTKTISVEGTFAFLLTGENAVEGNVVTLKNHQVMMGSEDVSANATVVVNVTLPGYNNAIQVESGKFTAPFTGAEYSVEYVVTYEGATYNYYDTVTVASNYTVEANEVVSFAEPAQMAKVHTYDSTVEWLAEYQGKTGVAKFDAKSWGYFGFQTMQEMSAYENATTLVIRMFIETEGYYGSLWFSGAKVYDAGVVTAGEWLEVRFSIDAFKTYWANNATSYDIWSMALSVSSAGVFYIDEIYTLTEEVTSDVVPANAISVLSVNDSATVSSIDKAQDVASVAYVDEFEGANGVLKITSSGNWVRFNVKPTQETENYAGYKYLVVRMYIESDFVPSLWLEPGGSAVYSTTTVETGKWVDYYFDGEVFYNQLIAGWNNYYSSICTNAGGVFYIDQVYMTNDEP